MDHPPDAERAFFHRDVQKAQGEGRGSLRGGRGDTAPDPPVELCSVEPAGHGWAGGAGEDLVEEGEEVGAGGGARDGVGVGEGAEEEVRVGGGGFGFGG